MKNKCAEINIINALRNDDQLALDCIIETYYTKLCSVVKSIIVNAHEAEDIVMKVFFRLWERRMTFKSEEHIRAYLFNSVEHESIHYILENKREIAHQEGYNEHLLEKAKYQLFSDELIESIKTKAKDLSPQCREVFMLFYFDGLKNREIAELLNITESTVRNHKARAIELIKLAYSNNYILLAFFSLLIECCEN